MIRRVAALEEAHAELSATQAKMLKSLEENTTATNTIAVNTAAIVEFFEAGKGFFRVAGFIGKAAKWITTVAAAGIIVWAAIKLGLGFPPPKNGGGD